MIILYQVTNILNHNSYIGYTTRTLEKRKSGHFKSVNKGSNLHFHNALRKYGSENFIWEIIEQVEDIDTAKMVEIWYIEQYQPEYNMTKGGDGFSGPHTEEAKNKISLAQFGRKRAPFSEEWKQNLSLANKGHESLDETNKKISQSLLGNKRALGHKHSTKTKLEMSLAHKDKKHTKETKDKISLALKDKKRNPLTKEHKKNLSLALKYYHKHKKLNDIT